MAFKFAQGPALAWTVFYFCLTLAFLGLYACAVAAVLSPSPLALRWRIACFLPLVAITLATQKVSGHGLLGFHFSSGVWMSLFGAAEQVLVDPGRTRAAVERELGLRLEAVGTNQRMEWAAKLASGDAVGEKRLAASARKAEPPSKWLFALQRTLTALSALLVAELINVYNLSQTPALYKIHTRIASLPSLAGSFLVQRYANVLLFGVPLVLLTTVLPNAIGDVYMVMTGAETVNQRLEQLELPSRGSPIRVSSPMLLYSIRNFWGKWWHQRNRWFLTAHARWLAHRLLGLQRGTKASAYTQLFAVFFLSGTMHVLPEYGALGRWPPAGGGLRFFLLQAVGITLEDFAIRAGRRIYRAEIIRDTAWGWKIGGFLWLWTWLALTVPQWLDPLLHAGLYDPVFRSWVVLPLWNKFEGRI
ncbi:hypothetical protein MIND_01227200 [Mycena indigotica]|uniref:Wax synthase domain-containing protein n=1 Tax=Mycena indigotica TaxID=2126181 RepID=A0A8H6S658_9AGAR|nr:uncharacterized protein MIND_01227200 [Mycena indigotica]KAF7292015.1 hypothetical protein MIND_01227200 [Mycena indigotica]